MSQAEPQPSGWLRPDLTGSGTSRGRWAIALTALGLLACLLRIPGLDRPVVGDEQTTVTLVSERSGPMLRELIAYDAHPPLYPVLLRAWAMVSRELWWLRALSLVCVVGSVLIMVVLVRRVFGIEPAWCAGLLAAFSPLLIFLSQYARPYALAMLLSTAAAWCATRWLEHQGRGGRWWLAAAGVCLAALPYTFYLSLFAAAALGLAVGFAAWRSRRAQLRWWIAAVLLAGLAWLPWLPAYAEQMRNVAAGTSSSTPLLKRAGLGAYLGTVQVGALAKPVLALWQVDEPRALTTRFSAHLSDWRLIAAGVAGLALTAITAWAGWRTLLSRQRFAGAAGLVLALIAVPIAGAEALSLAGDLGWRAPVAVNVRYFGDGALWMTVVAAAAWSAIRTRAVARGLLCMAVGAMALQLPRVYRYPFQDQAAMLAALETGAVTGVVSVHETSAALLDAAGQATFRSRYAEWILTRGQEGLVAEAAAKQERLALIERTTAEWIASAASAANGLGLIRSFEERLERLRFRKIGERRISDMLTIHSYHREAAR